jgi:hypothetical protein
MHMLSKAMLLPQKPAALNSKIALGAMTAWLTLSACMSTALLPTASLLAAPSLSPPLLVSSPLVASNTAITSYSLTKTTKIRPYKAIYKAEYKESIIPITVTGTRRFKATSAGKWEVSFVADTFLADLREVSPLTIKDDKLIPDSYYYRTTGIASEYFEHRFDWRSNQVFDIKKDRFWRIKLIPGTQNNITYQEQMRQDIKAGKQAFSYPVAYRGKLKTYEFKVVGEETIDSAIGTVDCIKIEQLLNKYNKLTTFIWLSKQHDYILIKINQKRGKKPAQEIQIQSVEFLDA